MINLSKITKKIASAGALVALLISPLTGNAAGLLTPNDGSYGELEIQSHDVEVTIQDGYVITEVEQVFNNPHHRDLEALYMFPIPEKALVSSFTVWIDGQPVVGEVLEKKKAREIYEAEKQAGREAGLTEQKSWKRFEVSVSPVRAQSSTRIKLQYMQLADIDTGIGRYVYPLEEGGTDEQKLSFWTASEQVKERFSFKLNLRSAYPVDAVRLPDVADAMITQHGPGEWSIAIERNGSVVRNTSDTNMANGQDDIVIDDQLNIEQVAVSEQPNPISQNNTYATELNQDLVVYWRMAQNLPGSLDLVAYKKPGASKGTFMMVMTPGDDLPVITEGRDWMFILDISGSMQGKYHTLVEGVTRAMEKMQTRDRFRIVVFNNNAKEITSGWTEINEENVRMYSHAIAQVQPDSGTNLFDGIKKGLSALDSGRTTGVVLVTDGVANIGETGKKGFLKLLKKYDVRLFSFIMGNEANRPLLESIAKHSKGFAVNISNNDDIVGKLMEATQKINHQAMHDVKVKISGVRTSDVTPSHFGTVYRGEQLVVLGNYWNAGEVMVDLSAKVSGQPKQYSTRFNLPDTATDNPELERIWAFANIQTLQDEQDLLGESQDRKQAIMDLALEHGLVTQGTSMVVMREEQFAAYNIERKNRQRVEQEAAAQKKRASTEVKQQRVDQNASSGQPMFSSNRSSHSGSGAFDFYWFVLLLPLSIAGIRQRIKSTGLGK